MNSGYFRRQGSTQRPYIDLIVRFPVANNQSLRIAFLVDTRGRSNIDFSS